MPDKELSGKALGGKARMAKMTDQRHMQAKKAAGVRWSGEIKQATQIAPYE